MIPGGSGNVIVGYSFLQEVAEKIHIILKRMVRQIFIERGFLGLVLQADFNTSKTGNQPAKPHLPTFIISHKMLFCQAL